MEMIRMLEVGQHFVFCFIYSQGVGSGSVPITAYEEANELELFARAKAQLPEDRHGEPQDEQVNNHVGNGVPEEPGEHVDAGSGTPG